MNEMSKTEAVLAEVQEERARQDARWGQQDHPDGTGRACDVEAAILAKRECQENCVRGTISWRDILMEEVAEGHAEFDPVQLRAELIQVAAVAVAWIEAIDRRTQAYNSLS